MWTFLQLTGVLITFECVIGAEARLKRTKALKRSKRDWVLPPSKLWENTDYTKKEFIAKIRSDKSQEATVEYYLSGPGANEPPFNLFVVNHGNGYVRITDVLDREKCQEYSLKGIAKYPNGTLAEDEIPLNIVVLDKNDNAPSIKLQKGTVKEESKKGTLVMRIKGEDADQNGTNNANLTYSIVSQEPPGKDPMFMINKYTGDLYVRTEPDREKQSFYKLVIKATDMGGAPGGLTGTGTVEIKVVDINDKIPTLEKTEYTGSVDENVDDVVVMRIQALDEDEKFTDNWLTVFKIVKGNEDNLFSIETDKETNEGILKLIKVQSLDLGLQIENVAPFVDGTAYPIKILVKNVPEGPTFAPSTKEIPLSEDPSKIPKDGIIAVFPAVDPDTGEIAEDVSYAKSYDPDNWFTIGEETAEIKLNKKPDRESPFLVNGTYIGKLLAISKDMPPKTATGTIAIQVADSNDHCPTLSSTASTLCSDKNTVFITAFDEDAYPNAAPFSFAIVPEGTKGSWDLEVINGTTAALHSQIALWPGVYELQVEVKDAQGLSCPTAEVFIVDVCICEETEECTPRMNLLKSTSVEMSAGAIGLLLMALCLLLLIPLILITCQFGGKDTVFPEQFIDLETEKSEELMSYSTEGRGDDKVGGSSPHFTIML
uniref:Si:ch73-74h11.1 n=1 Tax=Oryzias sinensis TaxID=183150 RepID=A0A8C8DQW4_9TELE